jgi:uncharacterized membrane protein YkvA (DUF1232 family)
MDAPESTHPSHLEDFARSLRIKLAAWQGSAEGREHPHGGMIGLVPDFFHLVVGLILDDRVPARFRSALVGAVIYVVSPADMLPEALVGPGGYVDDLVLMALVVEELVHTVPADVLAEHWPGSEGLETALRQVVGQARELVGATLLEKLHQWVRDA